MKPSEVHQGGEVKLEAKKVALTNQLVLLFKLHQYIHKLPSKHG
jgi:hypothetical protein